MMKIYAFPPWKFSLQKLHQSNLTIPNGPLIKWFPFWLLFFGGGYGKTTKLLGFKRPCYRASRDLPGPLEWVMLKQPYKGFSQKMAPQTPLPSILDPPRFRRVLSPKVWLNYLWWSFWRENFPGRCKGHGTLILLAYPLEVCGMVWVPGPAYGARGVHVLEGAS